jgi:signal recognition particle receptor subunit beta
MTAIDLSGQDRYTALWECYYPEASALVFVADAADPSALQACGKALSAALASAELKRKCPLLVLANKMDLPGAAAAAAVADLLGLKDIADRPWQIVTSSAVTGEGIEVRGGR